MKIDKIPKYQSRNWLNHATAQLYNGMLNSQQNKRHGYVYVKKKSLRFGKGKKGEACFQIHNKSKLIFKMLVYAIKYESESVSHSVFSDSSQPHGL